MTLEIGLLLGIVVAAIVLFSMEQLRPDIVALGILLAVGILGLLPASLIFAGFGSDTVAMIFGLLVLTAALNRTGVIDDLSRNIFRHVGNSPKMLLPVTMALAALLSAFISNTATTALFLPIMLELSRRTNTPRARLLMPLAFSTILASSITLVASSTNVLVSGLMTTYGLAPLGMFELARAGIPIVILGFIYMLVIGNKIIPVRDDGQSETTFGIRPYLTEALVVPGSPLIGKTIAEAALGRDLDLTIVRLIRNGNQRILPLPDIELKEEDELLIKGDRNRILQIKDTAGLAFKAEVKLSDLQQREKNRLAEAVILPRSPVIGRTLKTLRFRQRYGLQVLGINRRGREITSELSTIRFRAGDELLVQGTQTNIASLEADNIHIIGVVHHRSLNRRRGPIAISAFAIVLLLAAFNVVSLPVAVTVGTLIVFVTRCITPDEAYDNVEWQAIIVIGSMLALGTAMEYTGTAAYLAHFVTDLPQLSDPTILLSLFFALTMLLTQPMSNQAAAALVLPIAIETARGLQLNPRTFAVMIAVSASCSFITPLEPASLLVYSPGNYKFRDFTKVGIFLTGLIYLLSILLIPRFWPLTP